MEERTLEEWQALCKALAIENAQLRGYIAELHEAQDKLGIGIMTKGETIAISDANR